MTDDEMSPPRKRWRCVDCGHEWEGPMATRYAGDGSTFIGFASPICTKPATVAICGGRAEETRDD